MRHKRVCPAGHPIKGLESACPTCGGPVPPEPTSRSGIVRWLAANRLMTGIAVALIAASVRGGLTLGTSTHRASTPVSARAAAVPVVRDGIDCSINVGNALTAVEVSPDRAGATARAALTLGAPSVPYRIFSAHLAAWLASSTNSSKTALDQVVTGVMADCVHAYGMPKFLSSPPTPVPVPLPPAAGPPLWARPAFPTQTRPLPTSVSAAARSNRATAAQLVSRTRHGGNAKFVTCINDLVNDVVVGMTFGDDDTTYLAQTGGLETLRYNAAQNLVNQITNMYGLPINDTHKQTALVARQGMLDINPLPVNGPCLQAAGLPQ